MDRVVQRATLRKLELINAARDVDDLRIPPGKWRLCFFWEQRGAEDVELVDDH